MFAVTDRISAKTILSTFAAIGATAPEPVAKAAQRIDTLTAAIGKLAPGQEALYLAIINALDEGRDPAADAEVQRVLTAQAIANEGVMRTVPAMLHDHLREACREHVQDIFGAWRKAFDGAAGVLAAVHAELGAVDLEDTGSIIRRGAAAAESWGKAQTALATIQAIQAGWSALDSFTTGRNGDRRHAMLTIADADFETWTQHGLEEHKAEPWTAVTMGLRLSLPTPSEYTQRVARIQQAQQAEDDREARAMRDRAAGRRVPA